MTETDPIPPRCPSLVLLPGLDGTGNLFRRFLDALDPGIRTAVVSYPQDQAVDYAGLQDIVRSSLPRQEPFVLLAESFSGPIAISIAASRPSGLCGLILTCSFARNPRPWLTPLRPAVRFLPVRAAPVALLAIPAFGRFATPALRGELAAALSRVAHSVIRSRLGAVLDVDVRARLAQVDVPALYLRASEDRLVPASAADDFAAMPRIRFDEIEGPHLLLQARPAQVAAQVQAFLREIEAGLRAPAACATPRAPC
jgi:pimeloyl-[acyl-carrier protein] methyl ester esterase